MTSVSISNGTNNENRDGYEEIHVSLIEQIENVMRSLKSLQQQCTTLDGDKSTFKGNVTDQLQSGLNEAELMRLVYTYLQHVHGKKHKLALNVQRLTQENAWLREELTRTQLQLLQCQEKISTLEVEKEQLAFMQQLHERYDPQLSTPILTDESQPNNPPQSQQAPNMLNPQEQTLNTSLPTSLSQEFFGAKTAIGAVKEPGLTNSQASLGGGSNIAVSGYEIPSRLRVLHNLVVKYANEERYEVAVPLCNQALDDLKRDCGPNSPDVATMQNILAMLYRDQGKLNEAITLLNEALMIRETALGPEDPAVAATLNNLAVLYGKLGRFKEAEPLCRRSLKIREKVLGENHIDVAKQLNNLALLCHNLGRYEEVESYYQRALSIYRAELGANDANVAKTMNNLASSYMKQGKLSEAEALFRTVIHSLCTHHGASSQPTPLTAEPDAAHVISSTTVPPPVSLVQINLAAEQLCRQCPKQELQTLLTSIQNLTMVLKKYGRVSAAEHMEKWSNAIITAYAEFTGSVGSTLLTDSSTMPYSSSGLSHARTIGNVTNPSQGPASSLRRLSGKIAAKIWPHSSSAQESNLANSANVAPPFCYSSKTGGLSSPVDSLQPRFLVTASSAKLAASQTSNAQSQSRKNRATTLPSVSTKKTDTKYNAEEDQEHATSESQSVNSTSNSFAMYSNSTSRNEDGNTNLENISRMVTSSSTGELCSASHSCYPLSSIPVATHLTSAPRGVASRFSHTCYLDSFDQ